MGKIKKENTFRGCVREKKDNKIVLNVTLHFYINFALRLYQAEQGQQRTN